MKNQVDPDIIIYTVEENFKDELSKPKLRNLILTSIAIGKTEKLKMNEIAKNLPVDVKHKKSKQTRLMRFLNSYLCLSPHGNRLCLSALDPSIFLFRFLHKRYPFFFSCQAILSIKILNRT